MLIRVGPCLVIRESTHDACFFFFPNIKIKAAPQNAKLFMSPFGGVEGSVKGSASYQVKRAV